MRKILSLRFLVFLALLPVAILLFWEGRKYHINPPSRGINYAGYPYA